VSSTYVTNLSFGTPLDWLLGSRSLYTSRTKAPICPGQSKAKAELPHLVTMVFSKASQFTLALFSAPLLNVGSRLTETVFPRVSGAIP
jgi:hypothetical protein